MAIGFKEIQVTVYNETFEQENLQFSQISLTTNVFTTKIFPAS